MSTSNPETRTSSPRRGKGLAILGGSAAVVVVLAVGVYVVFLGGNSKPRLTVNSGTTGAAAAALPSGTLAGHWTVAAGSVAGYRVREKLGPLPAPTDAVGRSPAVSGEMTIDGSGTYTATNIKMAVDVTQLQSDQARRDGYIKTHALETTKFPQATFVANGPIDVPAATVTGATATVPVTGQLTIHGAAKAVTIPLQVRRDAAQIDMAGTLQFPFSEFGMIAPNIASFVTVQSDPTLEFRIVLQRAG
jgi:polyisoprenoid-binding protein YceI